MKKLYFTFLAISVSALSNGQNTASVCDFDEHHNRLMQTDINYQKRIAANERAIQAGLNSKLTGGVLTIPVVFHILHTGQAVGTGSNISDDQVLSAVAALNRDFRYTNEDGGIAQSGPMGSDSEIEFCLASVDPQGNPSTGILRVDASSTSGYGSTGITNANDAACKALSKWDNTQYMNVWVVEQIRGQGDPLGGGYTGGVQGYAYFPGAGPDVDGIVQLYSATGNDPTGANGYSLWSATDDGRVLTHEVGHYLNLFHTFQGQSCSENDCTTDGDRVCDTPPTSTGTGCNNGPCPNTHLENYMDYNNRNCVSDFTPNQIERMRAALTTIRSGLLDGNKCSPSVEYDALVSQDGLKDTLCVDSIGVNITLRNAGSEDLTSAVMTYSLDGGPISTLPINGLLQSNEDTTLSISLNNLSVGLHTFVAYVDTNNLNNGILDGNPFNNLIVKTFIKLPTPNVSLTSSASTFCYGEQASFTAVGGLSYSWNTGATTPTVSFPVYTSFDLQLTVNTLIGCEMVFNRPIEVDTFPTLTLDQTEVALCVGGAIDLSAQGTGDYLWSTSQTSSEIEVSPQSPTTYYVSLTNSAGCTSIDSVFVDSYVFESNITASNLTVCDGASVTLIGSPAKDYLWSTGENGQSIQVSPSSQTTFTLVASDSSGCLDNASITIDVSRPDTAFISPEVVKVCAGESVTLTSHIATDYLWASGETSQEMTLTPTTDMVMSLTVTDVAGCIGYANAVIDVVTEITGVIIEGDAFICEGETTTLSANPGYNYAWSNGATTQQITIAPLQDETISVVLSSGNCTSASIPTYIQVDEMPFVSISANTFYPGLGQPVNFTYTSNADTYEWDFGDGTTSSNPFATKIYPHPGLYNVQLTGYTGSCQATDQAQVIVSSASSVGSINDAVLIAVYPNPAKDILNIQFIDYPSSEPVTYNILNAVGELVHVKKNQVGELNTVNTSTLADGNYLLQIRSESINKHIQFIKKR